MDSQNAYDKAKVINAAKRALVAIQQNRENERIRICSGHKTFFGFGRTLSVNEYWDRQPPLEHTLISYLYLGQEIVIRRIGSAAEKCLGDTINLTNRELEMIEDCWE